MNLAHLIVAALWTVALFAAATGIGRLVLRRWAERFDSTLAFNCLAAGAGAGIVAHATLVLGLVGMWRAAGFIPLGIVAATAAAAGFRRARNPAKRAPFAPPNELETIAAAALALVVACLGLRAAPPPANYDVLEYHLGAVRHWLRAGAIFPFPHLFYASLPLEVEMLYAAGAFAEGNPLLPAVPKLINFGLLLGNLATIYALASALGYRRPARLLACLLFAIHPLTAICSSDALNDLGLGWFAALSCLAWVGWVKERTKIFFILWAAMLGLALCCKYTAAGLLIFPAAAILLPVAAFARNDRREKAGAATTRRLLGGWVALALIVGTVFSPWALKNVIHHGNPVYPLLSGIFHSPTWSPEQTRFYLAEHGRTDPLHAAYWAALARNIGRIGPWLLLIAAIGCGARSAPRAERALAAALGAGLAVHSLFPGNPARFMVPFLPVGAVLCAGGIERIRHPRIPIRAAVLAPLILWIGLGLVAAVAPTKIERPSKAFAKTGLPVFAEGPSAGDLAAYILSRRSRIEVLAEALGCKVVESQLFINTHTPRDARIFLLYEARIGCFDRPVEVGSVFDRSPLLERAEGLASGEQLVERLRREGFDYLYVNEFELARLARTYGPRSLYLRRAAGAGGDKDIRTVASWFDLYPPFHNDPRFASRKRVIGEFLAICRGRAVYTLGPGFPYGLWIAPLGEPKE